MGDRIVDGDKLHLTLQGGTCSWVDGLCWGCKCTWVSHLAAPGCLIATPDRVWIGSAFGAGQLAVDDCMCEVVQGGYQHQSLSSG
jgi:hypothetical protein